MLKALVRNRKPMCIIFLMICFAVFLFTAYYEIRFYVDKAEFRGHESYDREFNLSQMVVNWSDPIESCSSQVLNKYLLNINDSFPLHFKRSYPYKEVPKRTLTYWLSHIESQRRLEDKAFFADKYLVKQYIEDYKSTFSYINYAHVLYDEVNYNKSVPSFAELLQLKEKYKAFLIKPNHYCMKQIIVKHTSNITHELHDEILQFADEMLQKQYTKGSHLQPHYLLIKPHVYIEEHLDPLQSETMNDKMQVDVDGNAIMDDMIEYRMLVINYRCLFLWVTKKPYKNLYTAHNFTLLDVQWGVKTPSRNLKLEPPSLENRERMIEFSEHFAKRERFPFLRIDLYILRNKIYFSEFTFTPMMTLAKLAPVAFDYWMYDVLCNASQQNIDRIYEFAAKPGKLKYDVKH